MNTENLHMRSSAVSVAKGLLANGKEDIFSLVMNEVEEAILRSYMHHFHGNQTQVAKTLGLNRGTMRKKIKKYGML